MKLVSLSRDKPYAIVADGRMRDLPQVLDSLLPQLPGDVRLWLSHSNGDVEQWAKTKDIQVVDIDHEESLSLVVPSLPKPIKITRLVLDPVQLVFLGRNEISSDDFLLGAVYTLAYLIPKNCWYEIAFDLPAVLMELYLRFGSCPAVVPLRGIGGEFAVGDPWALDEAILKHMPSKVGKLHAKLRSELFPPEVSVDVGLAPSCIPRNTDRVFARSHGLEAALKAALAPLGSLANAFAEVSEAIHFRLKRRWHQLSRS